MKGFRGDTGIAAKEAGGDRSQQVSPEVRVRARPAALDQPWWLGCECPPGQRCQARLINSSCGKRTGCRPATNTGGISGDVGQRKGPAVTLASSREGWAPTYLLALHVPGGHKEGHVPVREVPGQLVCPHQGPAGQEAPLQVAPAERRTERGRGQQPRHAPQTPRAMPDVCFKPPAQPGRLGVQAWPRGRSR